MSLHREAGRRVRPDFIRVARSGRNELRLYLLGIALVGVGYLVASGLAASVLFALGGQPEAGAFPSGPAGDWGPALTLALVLAPSAWLLLAVVGVARGLHRRPALSLVRSDLRVRWGRIVTGAGLWALFGGLAELVAFAMYPESYRWALVPGRFLPLLLAGLVFIPLQSAAEELLFRGYLLQGLGIKLGGPWPALLASSVVFGLVHAGNPELARFGPVFLLYYIAMGVVLGLATLLDDGLELAVGAHTANNLYGALVVSFPGSVLDTPSLVRMRDVPPSLMALLGGVASVCWLLALFGYRSWGSTLGPAPSGAAEIDAETLRAGERVTGGEDEVR